MFDVGVFIVLLGIAMMTVSNKLHAYGLKQDIRRLLQMATEGYDADESRWSDTRLYKLNTGLFYLGAGIVSSGLIVLIISQVL